MEAVVEDVSAKPQVTVFVSKLCEVFVVEILMLLKCISSIALCIKFYPQICDPGDCSHGENG